MPKNLALAVTQDSVTKALEKFLKTKPELRDSTRWDLVYKDKRFPPKEVIREAARLQGIEEWYKLTLSGGESVNDPLRKMGFVIEEKQNLSKNGFDGSNEVLKNFEMIDKMPLNTIMYGPPGTGKTYHTINKAVERASPGFDLKAASRQEIKEEFERLTKEGRVAFVTFHQSMAYEDFIEGIKPVEPKEGDAYLKYEVNDGIFKRLAIVAGKTDEVKQSGFSITNEEYENANFYKISLGDTSNSDDSLIYTWCIQNGYIALGWGGAIDFTGKSQEEIQQMASPTFEGYGPQAVNYFIHSLKIGDYVVVTEGNLKFRAIGRVTGNYEYLNIDKLTVHQFRKVEWLLKDHKLPYEEVYEKKFSQQSIYRLNKDIIKKNFFVKEKTPADSANNSHNYVLIIDEINRGNVSQIFGELITLIEDDKRKGGSEALEIILPYSKEKFSVPDNLYIIGTMNTADRSVEALDTALRRRFDFEEMAPQPHLLSPQRMLWQFWWENYDYEWEEEEFIQIENSFYELLGIPEELNTREQKDFYWLPWERADVQSETQIDSLNEFVTKFTGVDLSKLLMCINARLAKLLGRDYMIGHAYFINVRSIEDLKKAFHNKIIPLLQEYFYSDFAQIGLVLGQGFVYKDATAESGTFATFYDFPVDELADRNLYKLYDVEKMSNEAFLKAIKDLLN